MRQIDALLNRITMYRLVLYVLAVLASLGVIFALVGRLSFSPTDMLLSFGIIGVSAYVTNRGFARLFNVPTNSESWLITSLILFLIVQPAASLPDFIALGLAGGVSSASKFLVAYSGKHVFNPAAFAAALLSLTGLQPTTWWVGSTIFWPFALVLGLAVVRKVRRFPLFLTFVIVSVVLQFVLFAVGAHPLATSLRQALLASPLIFLSTIMLTEPATMPPRRAAQMVFAALVAVLYVTAWRAGPFVVYPEVALLIGNIYAYAVSPRFRALLRLTEVQKISDRVYTYVFQPETPFHFLPGQYMEWTLAGVPYDSRGNRRTFTIASSPTESTVRLGLKHYNPSSTYKAAFSQLQPGDMIYTSQLAGNFTLPRDPSRKLAFIAGGIGITPFRSMVKYLADTGQQRDIVLLYAVSDPAELAYMQEFMAAAPSGVRTLQVVTKPGVNAPGAVAAQLSSGLLAQLVPDYAERTFYVSGPSTMVDASKHYLRALGVHRRHVKTDHFSGY